MNAVGTMKRIENFRFDTRPFFVLFGQPFRILPQEAISGKKERKLDKKGKKAGRKNTKLTKPITSSEKKKTRRTSSKDKNNKGRMKSASKKKWRVELLVSPRYLINGSVSSKARTIGLWKKFRS